MKRSLHEETFTKEKYAKYNDASSSQVVLILHDFKMVPSNELHQCLTRKFQNQSKGKAKWLIRKEEILNNNGDQKDNPLPSFIPIEFSDDVQVIVHLIGKTITCKSANYTITDKNMRKLITKGLKERNILLEKNLNIEKTLLEFKTIHDLWKLYEYSFLLYNPKFMLEMSKKFELFLL